MKPLTQAFATLDRTIRPHLATPVAALLLCALSLPMLTGCTPSQQQTTLQVVAEINTHLPEVVAAAGTAAATVSALLPADAAIVGVADVAFTTGATTLEALTASYLKTPTASVFAQIQAAIATLEGQIDTATLNALGIKDQVLQNTVLAALKGLLTIVTVVFAAIAPTLSTAQLLSLRERNTIHLAKVRPYMNEQRLQQEAGLRGVDLDKAFRQAESAGF